jgi:hypothetical protein
LHIIQKPHEQIISQACKIIVILSISNFTHFQTPPRPQRKKKKNAYLKYVANKRKLFTLHVWEEIATGRKTGRNSGRNVGRIKKGENSGRDVGRNTGRNKARISKIGSSKYPTIKMMV